MSAPLERFRDLVDYTRTLDCIHCGLCLKTCPTYQLTGQENSSPRGRIHLMRAVAESRLEPGRSFAEEMEFCLLCRHCESVCPSGVQFGPLMESAREALESARPGGLGRRLLRWIAFRQVLPQAAVLSLLALGLAFGQRTGLLALLGRLVGRRAPWINAAAPLPTAAERRRLASQHPAKLKPGLRPPAEPSALFLEGCVMPLWFGRVNRAAVQSLQHLGLDVQLPKDVVCCGSLHAHNGDADGARELAKRLISATEAAGPGPLIIPSAGCSAHLRELQHLFAHDDPWQARARAVAARSRDYAQFIAGALHHAGFPETASKAPNSTTNLTVAWDDPCHLCHAQQVRAEPRQALDALPNIRRIDLENSETCCGAAGIYNLLHPEASAELLTHKAQAFARSGAQALVTANPGCHLQFSQGLPQHGIHAPVYHLAELVAAALEGQPIQRT
jgi:glycolate oxidase iron-sulfur subunit